MYFPVVAIVAVVMYVCIIAIYIYRPALFVC